MADVKFEVVRFALNATTANTQDITISGFGTPKAAIFFTSLATTDDTITDDAAFSIGWTDGTTDIVCAVQSEDSTGFADTRSRVNTNRIITPLSITGSPLAQFSFDSWITDGVRIYADSGTTAGYLVTCVLIGGSDVTNAYVGVHDDLGTGTSAVDITAPGFEPDMVFMQNVNGSGGAYFQADTIYHSFGVGINDGSDTQRSIQHYAQYANATTNVRCSLRNDAITGVQDRTAYKWKGTIGSYDASGFSITPSASTASTDIYYLALKFSGSPNLSLFDMSIPTTGNYAETTPGFTPNFGLISTVNQVATRNVQDTASVAGLNWHAFDDSNVYTTAISDNDNLGTTNTTSLASDQFRGLSNGGAEWYLGSAPVFDADGWDSTLTTNPTNTSNGWGLAIGSPVVTKTLKSTGGDYSLMSTWESTEQTDLVTAGQSHVLECYDDWPSGLVDNLAIGGWTTGASNFITVKTATGAGHGGVFGNGFYMIRTGTGITLDSQMAYTVVRDMEIRAGSNGSSAAIRITSAATNCLIERTMVRAAYGSSDSGLFVQGADTIARNCHCQNGRRGFVADSLTSSTADFQNCTVRAASQYGFYANNSANARLTNCVAVEAATADFSGTFGSASSNNASSDTTAKGTSPVTSITTAAFEDYAGGDYHPAAGGALAGAGTDLSADFLDDITGSLR